MDWCVVSVYVLYYIYIICYLQRIHITNTSSGVNKKRREFLLGTLKGKKLLLNKIRTVALRRNRDERASVCAR